MKFARNLTIAVFVIIVTHKSRWVTSEHDYRVALRFRHRRGHFRY